MDTYFITLSKGSVIYRGFSERNKEVGNWYAYTTKDASMYGKIIKSYTIKEDIKLINIMNPYFHIDYTEKLHIKYPGSEFNGYDDRKLEALIPLGLPDIETQQTYLRLCGNSIEKTTIREDFYSRIFYNKNRLSVYDLDSVMTSCIREFFQEKCDGFTNPYKYTDKYTGGSLAREIYIFDLTKIEYIETINLGGGGELVNYIVPFQMSREEFSKGAARVREHMQKFVESMPMLKRDDGTESPNILVKKARRNKTRKNRPSDDAV